MVGGAYLHHVVFFPFSYLRHAPDTSLMFCSKPVKPAARGILAKDKNLLIRFMRRVIGATAHWVIYLHTNKAIPMAMCNEA